MALETSTREADSDANSENKILAKLEVQQIVDSNNSYVQQLKTKLSKLHNDFIYLQDAITDTNESIELISPWDSDNLEIEKDFLQIQKERINIAINTLQENLDKVDPKSKIDKSFVESKNKN